MIPNIFDIATKELHQDAFIVWLIKWADPENEKYDPLLHACGQDFVKQLISKQYNDSISSIIIVEAGRQFKNIDVWAKIYTLNGNYYLIIEDKIFTTEHSDQLLKYKKLGEEYAENNNFIPVFIYLKTGSESAVSMDLIILKEFNLFKRQDFFDLLEKHKNITNNIFTDYRNRLSTLHSSYQAFQIEQIGSWDKNPNCWIGFYQFLETQFSDLNWSFVNRRDGSGFWNAYFIPAINDRWYGHSVYLQIEQGKLCFKINTSGSEKDRVKLRYLRNELGKIIIEKAAMLEISEIQKPKYPGTGEAMTVAVIEIDGWLGENDSIIDKEAVVIGLEKYKAFLRYVLNN
ncbi:PD-(D/E)XK nuclease family protein [Dyadobacter sp. 3J3]|uniref:PD-(D/E)XK nuclease family protein n=1 Tax=Dyadobacter sp. 3J3 TaxID=2606600 RepID=UPI00135C775E|nr:PD-(D/E)XK nuclease family protein [Dyadobacter sp. 3J3]